MYFYLLVCLLFIGLWLYSATGGYASKRKRIDYKRKNDDGSGKYIIKGYAFLIQHIFYTYIRPSNKASDGTVFDQLYNRFGSPKSKDAKATFIVKYFTKTIVYIRDYNTTKMFLTSNCCTDRTPQGISEVYCGGPLKGVTFNNGDAAKELRRYTMKTLGRLGFGKTEIMSHNLNEALTDLMNHLETLRKSTGNKIQVRNLFVNSALNIVWRFVGSDKYLPDGNELHIMDKNVSSILNVNLMQLLITSFLPRQIMRYIFPVLQSHEILHKYFFSYVKKRKLHLDDNNPIDFVDNFLLEIAKYRYDTELSKIYNEEQLIVLLIDMFVGGKDTTSYYMECSLMYMALNPYSQMKVQQEIDSVIGDSFPSNENHRKLMPFTQATIMEIHRMANIFSITSRTINKDCVIDNQPFTKGTWIIANFFYYRKDESYWGDPKVFRPERFIDSENNLLVEKMNHVLPFGAGPRECIGAQVASSTIFVFFTGILQKYNIRQCYLDEILELEKHFTATSRPNPFTVSFISRSTSSLP